MKEAWWLVDQLVQQGVSLFCIAPGSRSAPLAIAAEEHPKAKTHIHFDERGLGYYALGHSFATKSCTALIVTSGTAVANLAPCVWEAHHSCVPLLLLIADRPHELRDCGANQTTDQVGIFKNAVRWQVDLPPALDENYFRSVAAQAVFYALSNPPGPVHLNCQYREPLYVPFSKDQKRATPFSLPKLTAEPVQTEARRGVILIGRLPSPVNPILDLAKRLQWPVFADLLSQARCFPSDEQVRHFDWILPKAPLKPDLILHFGERLTSKKILEWEREMPHLHVSPLPFLYDPARTLTRRIQSDIEPFCSTFSAESDPKWLPHWQELDREMDEALNELLRVYSHFTEVHAVAQLSGQLPAHCTLFTSNSMTLRNADHFLFPPSCRAIFSNRGLSGCDGNVATSAGLADALETPFVSLMGDICALHDLNSFALFKKGLLILLNNFGGEIFSQVPAVHSPHFKKLFLTPHRYHFEPIAKMFDLPYLRVEERLPNPLPLSGILEITTSVQKNVELHKEVAQLAFSVVE